MKPVAGLGEIVIEVAGSPLEAEDAASLAELRVREALSLPAQCEIRFRGVGQDLAERAPLLMGLTLGLKLEEARIFSGEITAVEHGYTQDGGKELRLRAYDALHRLRKRQPVEIRNDVNAGELCRRFAGDLSLDADVSEEGPRWPQLAQWYQTDFELFDETARRAGLFFGVSDGALRLFTLAGTGDPIALTLGDDLLEAVFESNGDRAWSEVLATGWNPGTGERFEESAGSARSGRTAGRAVTMADVGGEGKRTLINTPVPAAEHLTAEAQAALDQATASALTVRGVAFGTGGIHPGCKVELKGVHQSFAGEYVVSEAVHTLDPERGFLTEFSSDIPARHLAAPMTAIAPGVVNRVDDPDDQGRVTVKLPGYAGVETGWLRVMLPGAGATKGFVALPDEGDEVLVVLPRGDPTAGVVLGGLFGQEDVPDTGIVDRRVRRQSWRSRKGHFLEIDDDQERMTIAHANGSLLRLSQDKVSLVAKTDFEIVAAGKNITITAASVDFRKG